MSNDTTTFDFSLPEVYLNTLPAITVAYNYQLIYAEALASWYDWLENHPTASLRLVLLNLIETSLEKLKPGGSWKDLDHFPTLSDIYNALDFNKPESRFNKFKRQAEKQRLRVEEAAVALVNHLSSENFYNEMSDIPISFQLVYAGDCIEKLSASAIGREFLHRDIQAMSQEEPIYSFSQLMEAAPMLQDKLDILDDAFPPVTAQNNSANWRSVIGGFVNLSNELLQIYAKLVIKAHNETISGLIDSYNRYFFNFTKKVLPPTGGFNPADLDLETFYVHLDEWKEAIKIERQNNPAYLVTTYGPIIANSIGFILDSWILIESTITLVRNPNLRKWASFVGSIASTAKSSLEMAYALAKRSPKNRMLLPLARLAATRGVTTSLGIVGGGVGAGLSGVDFLDAWQNGDQSLALGHSSLAASAVLLAMGPAFAFPGAIFLLVGCGLVMFTEDTQLDQVLTRCCLGKAWESNPASLDPGEIDYMWKGYNIYNGDVARQVSEFFSCLMPLNLQDVSLENDELTVIFRPEIITEESRISITPIGDHGFLVPLNDVRNLPLNHTLPDTSGRFNIVKRIDLNRLSTPDGDITIDEVQVVIDAADWYDNCDWVEVTLSTVDPEHSFLVDFPVLNKVSLNAEAFMIRQRKEIRR